MGIFRRRCFNVDNIMEIYLIMWGDVCPLSTVAQLAQLRGAEGRGRVERRAELAGASGWCYGWSQSGTEGYSASPPPLGRA